MFNCCFSYPEYEAPKIAQNPKGYQSTMAPTNIQPTPTASKVNQAAEKSFRLGINFMEQEKFVEAYEHLKIAVQQNHPKSFEPFAITAFCLGQAAKETYKFKLAFDLFQQAAQGQRGPEIDGMHRAQVALALLYIEGNGVEKNKALAEKWLICAKARGSDIADSMLQICRGATSITYQYGGATIGISGSN